MKTKPQNKKNNVVFMKYSFEDKIKYNQGRNSDFSNGYTLGADMYQRYLKSDEKMRRLIKKMTDTSRQLSKKGDQFSKGFMCAMRDASQARKSKQK